MTIEDIDRILEEVEKHGGKVEGKQGIPNMRWSAYFWDPEGNPMSLLLSTRQMVAPS
jgi:predicted enzyme related to lactoylglutathione lyase